MMDALAIHTDGNAIALVSLAGPETTIKAFQAMLCSEVKGYFEVEDARLDVYSGQVKHYERYCPNLKRDKDDGYDCFKVRLGYNTWHLLAVSRRTGFMPVLSDVALYLALRQPTITTPFLRDWLPWLTTRLMEEKLLVILDGFQTKSAMLLASSQPLDDLVSMGLRNGEITIPRRTA